MKFFLRSQFSAKDPTRPNNPPLSSSSRSNSRSNVQPQQPSTPTSQKNSINNKQQQQQLLTKTETFTSSSRSVETEVVTKNGVSSPQKVSQSNSTSSKSSFKTVSSASNGHHVDTDTPDRAASKQNIFEVIQERPIPGQRSSLTDNNNINVMKNNNGNNITLSSSQHDSMTSSEELPSFSSSIDDMELRDLRKAKREVDIRLVDREDQVETPDLTILCDPGNSRTICKFVSVLTSFIKFPRHFQKVMNESEIIYFLSLSGGGAG